MRELPLLETVGTAERLDVQRYLAANPDIAAAGADPLIHFRDHGRLEGRRQLVAGPELRAMREEKLSRISFRLPPAQVATTGALDYLPDEMKSEFNIPDAPPCVENNYIPDIIELIRARPDELFLDVGAGFRHTYYSNVVNTEIWPSPSTDILCLGENLPFSDESFDYVFCLAVLEHTKRPWAAIDEILRVLKPGGQVRIDWPFLQAVHGFPHHYFNATPLGAISRFEESCDIVWSKVMPWQHPIFGLHTVLREWHAGLPQNLRKQFEQATLGDILLTDPEISFHWPIVLELIPEQQKIIASGTTFVAQKR